MDDSVEWVEEEDDYPDDSREKGSAQQSFYLTFLKLLQPLSLPTLSTSSQDLNLCCNELPTFQRGSSFHEKRMSLFFSLVLPSEGQRHLLIRFMPFDGAALICFVGNDRPT
jgi:hypothetical protein